ncbi:MAG TPA: hypothetical protein DDW93_10285 [Firmicutes bacterium]|nr:hypothetical protein [Bacillota bacterium]HBK68663.1 hypothetical protein [Bacillota bacterium]HBT15744.1 hypothetical protein [Bacillota bacterium]
MGFFHSPIFFGKICSDFYSSGEERKEPFGDDLQSKQWWLLGLECVSSETANKMIWFLFLVLPCRFLTYFLPIKVKRDRQCVFLLYLALNLLV